MFQHGRTQLVAARRRLGEPGGQVQMGGGLLPQPVLRGLGGEPGQLLRQRLVRPARRGYEDLPGLKQSYTLLSSPCRPGRYRA
ncbi:hypothetical protein, partial [Nonomuraea sp. NPDC049709]|uniref:hypothetical protein n=1 Tax=Nonomuraea sp. NPDC049709 TaxID=3154736 RepID=UPI00342095E0